MNNIIILKLRITGCKKLVNGSSVKHIEAVTSSDPDISLPVCTHIIYTDIRKAIAGVEVLK
jgi:hypothetical protein